MMALKHILGGATAPARTAGIAAVVLSAVLLGACGQKGPLIQRPIAAASAAPDLPALPASNS